MSGRRLSGNVESAAGSPPIKAVPSAQPNYSLLFLNWGSLDAAADHRKRRLTFKHPLKLGPEKHTNRASVECNLVLPSLLWVSVVCCASEMKAGLSNNSEFNTSTSPLMRVPCVCSGLISAAPVGEEEARKEGRCR